MDVNVLANNFGALPSLENQEKRKFYTIFVILWNYRLTHCHALEKRKKEKEMKKEGTKEEKNMPYSFRQDKKKLN